MKPVVVKIAATLWISDSEKDLSKDKHRALFIDLMRERGFPGDRACWRCGKPARDASSTLIEDASQISSSTSTMGTTTSTRFRSFKLFVCVPRCPDCEAVEARVEKTTETLGCVMLPLFVLIVAGTIIAGSLTGDEYVLPIFGGGMAAVLLLVGLMKFMSYSAARPIRESGMNMNPHPDLEDAERYATSRQT